VDGKCLPIPAGTKSDDCPLALEKSCKNNGACDGKGGCQQYGTDVTCAEASCDSGAEVGPGKCDGKGTCGGGKRTSCSGRVCQGSSCKNCTPDSTSGCVSGQYCDGVGQSCTALKGTGSDCTAKFQCKTGNCEQPTDGAPTGPSPTKNSKVCCESCKSGTHCTNSGKCKSGSGGPCASNGDCDSFPGLTLECNYTCTIPNLGARCASDAECVGGTCDKSKPGICLTNN
jgi:hypothetical protein